MIKKCMLHHAVGANRTLTLSNATAALGINQGRAYAAPVIRVPQTWRGASRARSERELHMRSAQVSRVRQVTGALPMETAWEQLWREGVVPWDMQGVTPVVAALLAQGRIPEGRVLVPGCGGGHDAVAMASAARRVVGLDISSTALRQAAALASRSPNAAFVEFRNADFFAYAPPAKFDAVFDYTFFCALEPALRPRWAEKMADLLALDGELITLMFPLDDHEGGPPYAVSLEAYEKVLGPWGFRLTSRNDDIPSAGLRKGVESLSRWARTISKA